MSAAVGLALLRAARCLRQSECGNAQYVCVVYSPGDGCTFREQRQTALSCAAGTVLAAQLDTARSLGAVLNFGVNHVIPFSVYRSGESSLRCLRQLLLSTALRNQPTKGLTEGVDLREAQVDYPRSV